MFHRDWDRSQMSAAHFCAIGFCRVRMNSSISLYRGYRGNIYSIYLSWIFILHWNPTKIQNIPELLDTRLCHVILDFIKLQMKHIFTKLCNSVRFSVTFLIAQYYCVHASNAARARVLHMAGVTRLTELQRLRSDNRFGAIWQIRWHLRLQWSIHRNRL